MLRSHTIFLKSTTPTFPQELNIRTVKLNPESDHLFLPKVSSRNPLPRVPYDAPDHSWAMKANLSGVEIPGAETPLNSHGCNSL
jgi:hypothetical protein